MKLQVNYTAASQILRGMNCVPPPKTVSRMDARFEPPWMGLRRVFGGGTQFMPRRHCISLKPLFTIDMNRKHHAKTCREPTCTDVGNADIASLHGKDCSYNPIAFPPSMEVRCNLLGQCRSYCRGANICHPWGLGTRIRPPRTVEVQVLQEQKTCPAADGLSMVLPIHVSRV